MLKLLHSQLRRVSYESFHRLEVSSISRQVQLSRLIHTSTNDKKINEQFRAQLDNLGKNPSSEKEVSKLGLVKYMKKYRQYAQFSYRDYKIPKAPQGISISCTRDVIYTKLEEENKITSSSSLKDKTKKQLTTAIQEVRSNRAIKKAIKGFHKRRFPGEAHKIYLEAHKLLNTENWGIADKESTEDRLHELVTEHAYVGMVEGLDNKTIVWKFVQSIEAPVVVSIAHTPMLEEDNLYAQIVVRFHTKQILAVYDRFGRLMHGNADVPRNVLENVVFERHLSDNEGQWRIHAKLPSVAYEREPLKRTVAAIKKQPITSEQQSWHEQEKEVHPEIYYPEREWLMEEKENEKLINKDKRMYWRKKQKKLALRKLGYGLTRMRGKARRLTNKKKEKVEELRKQGKLPQPPKNLEE